VNTPTPEIHYVTLPAPSPITVVKQVYAPTSTPAPTYTPRPTYTPAPTATPFHQVAAVKVLTKTLYREVTRTTTRVKTRYAVKTVVRTRYVTKVKHVTVVRYRTRVITRYRTVTRVVAAYHYLQHPKTGRYAAPVGAPVASWQGSPPPAEAQFSIARLGIHRAPVWARGVIANSDGSFRYDLVPFYGVTRFSLSARFGQQGLSLLSGHDDIDGNIFRYLGTMRRGDVIQVWQGKHTYHYVVSSVQVVAPNDVSVLNAPRVRPTLALISCTPYGVDTHRVVVTAQMR